MKFPDISDIRTIDLVMMLKDAREWGDKEFVDYILIELGNRQKLVAGDNT